MAVADNITQALEDSFVGQSIVEAHAFKLKIDGNDANIEVEFTLSSGYVILTNVHTEIDDDNTIAKAIREEIEKRKPKQFFLPMYVSQEQTVRKLNKHLAEFGVRLVQESKQEHAGRGKLALPVETIPTEEE